MKDKKVGHKAKIAIITANFGNFDVAPEHAPQSIPYDYYLFTDENFPLRHKAMTPRLQARIPKCFAWQMVPGYEYYMWIDANLLLKHRDSLQYFFDNCRGYDVVTLRHHRRPNIRQEMRYIRNGLRLGSSYLVGRYENELLAEQYAAIENDKDYVDDAYLLSGAFMYKNTPEVQKALKEWWYNITRYHVIDQLAFVYSLKKAGLKINMLPDLYDRTWFLDVKGHRHHAK